MTMLELNRVYCGDAIELVKQLPDNSIDLILSDPPYGIGKEGVKNDNDLWAYNLGFNRVLKDNSWVGLYASVGRIGEVINILESDGLRYCWQHITYINNAMVCGRMGFSKYMVCLIFSKGEPKIKERMPDVFECSTSSQQRNKNPHPTPKKVGALRHIIRCLSRSGNIVLDPFIGSGTTAIACKETGRNYIGFEVCPEYVELSDSRLKQEVLSCTN